jgi:hypothetical protein
MKQSIKLVWVIIGLSLFIFASAHEAAFTKQNATKKLVMQKSNATKSKTGKR